MNWVPARRPANASKYSSNLAPSRTPSVSPISLDYGLHKCISKLARSRPPRVSPNSVDHGLQVYLQTRIITACKFARSWPPSAYLQTLLITANKCISKLARLRPPQVHSITPSKCISKYPRLPPPSASPKLLDHSLGVYLWVHSIVIFRRTSNCSQAPPAAGPDIVCVDGLLYRYIDT